MISRRTLVTTALLPGVLGACGGYRGLYAAGNAGHLFGVGPAGRCDDAKIGIGVPRWDAAERKFRMWYYCRDAQFAAEAPASLASGRVAMAESADGIHWQRVNGKLTKGAVLDVAPTRDEFDSLHVGVTDVIRDRDRDRWLMWTFGGNHEAFSMGGRSLVGYRMRAGLTASSDGVNWTRIRGPAAGGALVDIAAGDAFAAWPNGVRNERGQLVLFYTTTTGPSNYFHTHVTVSDSDGASWRPLGQLQWTDQPASWDVNGMMTRHVLANPFRGPRWLMVYTALGAAPKMERSIGAAVSDDLVRWSRLYDEPILTKADGVSWDSAGVSAPQLLVFKRRAMLYYLGLAPEGATGMPTGVGLAVSRSGSLKELRRYAG